jgi:hypothetical protein
MGNFQSACNQTQLQISAHVARWHHCIWLVSARLVIAKGKYTPLLQELKTLCFGRTWSLGRMDIQISSVMKAASQMKPAKLSAFFS